MEADAVPSGGEDELWSVELDRPFLVVRFPRELEVASWAVVGGGRRRTRTVTWLEVRNANLPAGVNPAALARRRLAERGLADSVGLLTSRRINRWHQSEASWDGLRARALVTLGLSNALRVGDLPGPLTAGLAPVGTINILVAVSTRLTEAAALEALSIAVEARTAAVAELGFASRRSGQPATGTGTDCVVLAWPGLGVADPYAGKHTGVGHLIGHAVLTAVQAGAATWLRDYKEMIAP